MHTELSMPTNDAQRPRISGASALLITGVVLAAVGLARSPQGGNNPNDPDETVVQPMPTISGGATADSNNRMIAVTGVDVTGASILFLVDTQKMRLAVYQAAGAGSNQGVRFVGARRIELDMELDGFNDKSEYSFKKLKEEFTKQGWAPGAAGVQVPAQGSAGER
jgi:hypothetical protein